MKVVDIFRVQKVTPLLRKICTLGWDGKSIVILKGQKYGKALLEEAEEKGGFLNPVTGKRIPPSRGLAFLKSLHECFKHLSYIKTSKLKRRSNDTL
ncbi:MAG: hypothetical protein GTN73_00055 [Candidatus Aminicenantes bacterium]|nr:hypothetical protein [Candidatus Aminicenantes bacterium]